MSTKALAILPAKEIPIDHIWGKFFVGAWVLITLFAVGRLIFEWRRVVRS